MDTKRERGEVQSPGTWHLAPGIWQREIVFGDGQTLKRLSRNILKGEGVRLNFLHTRARHWASVSRKREGACAPS